MNTTVKKLKVLKLIILTLVAAGILLALPLAAPPTLSNSS